MNDDGLSRSAAEFSFFVQKPVFAVFRKTLNCLYVSFGWINIQMDLHDFCICGCLSIRFTLCSYLFLLMVVVFLLQSDSAHKQTHQLPLFFFVFFLLLNVCFPNFLRDQNRSNVLNMRRRSPVGRHWHLSWFVIPQLLIYTSSSD